MESNNSDDDSVAELCTAKLAAAINKKRGHKVITVVQGMWIRNPTNIDKDIRPTVDCVIEANQIHPGTVEAFLFSPARHVYALIQQALEYITVLRKSVVGHLKLGFHFTDCSQSYHDVLVDPQFKKVFRQTDFAICVMDKKEKKGDGVETTFATVSQELLEIRKKFRDRNISREFMAQIKWASDGFDKWSTTQNMKNYFKAGNDWAKNNTFPIWYHEAFDNPVENPTTLEMNHFGWWKLNDPSRANQRNGYTEKISEENAKDSVKTETIVGVIVGLVVFSFLVSLITFLVFRVKKLKEKLSKQDVHEFVEGMSETVADQQFDHKMDSSALRLPYDKSFEIKKHQLKIHYDKMLGSGHFGCVFKASLEFLPNKMKQVALKVARHDSTREALRGFLSEIKMLIFIGIHPNVNSLVGAYTAELQKGVVYIATELCGLGSLEKYLREEGRTTKESHSYENITSDQRSDNIIYKNMSEPISPQQMLLWSQEIASGMEYLGSKNVIHADLATRNVLLTVDKTAKISDFGMSRLLYDHTYYIKAEQEELPWQWLALESLKKCEFSMKSDVWSYGVTIWEIFSKGGIPYPGISWSTEFVSMLEDGMRLGCPSEAPAELYNLMIACWHTESGKRLSFPDIQQILNFINVSMELNSEGCGERLKELEAQP